MEKEINIAEILKDKPQGTKLYDLLYNVDVELDTISTTDTETVVWCTNKTDNNTTCHRGYSEFGTVRGCPDGLQILLPSKSMRDWSKLAWKIGDLLTNNCGFQCIFKEWASDDYTKFNGCYSNSRDGYEDVSNAETAKFDKISNDTAYDYIREIERKLGGKLNFETLEIEQPEFKDGDILHSDETSYSDETIFIAKISDGIIGTYAYLDLSDNRLLFQDDSFDESENCKIRHATDSEKKKLFDELKKKGKTWDAEKKQIVDLPKQHEFNPFDCVITRVDDDAVWTANIFSHMDSHGEYVTIGCESGYTYCLPYNDKTAHLIGTTDEWNGGKQ